MSLPLTPDRLTATYACLRAFPPFNRLRLPLADQVVFKVTRSIAEHGHYNRYVGTDHHWIAISARNVGHFNTLAWAMGHEMIHLHQGITKTETPNTMHNAEFHRIAAQACRRFGWDLKVFV